MKKKIAVLGAGLGSLSTVYELTSLPDWKDKYDITVYQLGWRPGGKMSGGRGPNQRVEELGLHLLLGFYNHAFRLFEEVYKERSDRGLPDAGYPELKDALLKNNSLLFVEYLPWERRWVNWPIIVPERSGSPSDGPPGIMDGVRTIVAITLQMILGSPYLKDQGLLKKWIWKFLFPAPGSTEEKQAKNEESWWDKLTGSVKELLEDSPVSDLIDHERIIKNLEVHFPDPMELLAALEHLFQKVFDLLDDLLSGEMKKHNSLRRLMTFTDLTLAILHGVLTDVYNRETRKFDFKRINHLDFRAWLKNNGANKETLESSLVYFFYNAPFNNFTGPTPEQGNNLNGGSLAAGTAMQFLLQGAGYRGSIFNQMRMGTADTLIMPLYQVLESRGVKFEFFHKVTSIVPSSDGKSIGEVQMDVQVKLAPGVQSYNPVDSFQTKDGITVPFWPGSPLYAQIDPTQAAELQALEKKRITLESPFSPWKGESKSLKAGQDYDTVLLGIPVPTLRYGSPDVCKPIFDEPTNPTRASAWKNMAMTIQSTQVMSAQLWFEKSLEEMGFIRSEWGLGEINNAPNIVSYAYPVFSLLDQTQFLEREDWPSSNLPKTVIAYTNSMLDLDSLTDPPEEIHTIHYIRIQEAMRQWLWDNMGWLLKGTERLGAPTGIDWTVLTGENPQDSGVDKYDYQFMMSTLNPSDRYVNAAPYPTGENPRIKPDESGYENLYLAGDWTDYGYNFGYMEGTILSGLIASNAIQKLDHTGEGRPLLVPEDLEI